jgi:hypothetical protein
MLAGEAHAHERSAAASGLAQSSKTGMGRLSLLSAAFLHNSKIDLDVSSWTRSNLSTLLQRLKGFRNLVQSKRAARKLLAANFVPLIQKVRDCPRPDAWSFSLSRAVPREILAAIEAAAS